MQQFTYALPARTLPAAKQTACLALLAKKVSTHCPRLLLLLITMMSAIVQAGAQTGGCTTPSFATPIQFNGIVSPDGVVTGDFNGDGKTDMVSASSAANNVAIVLGNGAGGFSAAVYKNVGESSFSITKGDFNKDGKLDIATANRVPNNVSVLLGDGAGGFANPVNFSVGTYPYSITTGDFNKDGKLDLVTANATSNSISVLLGNGTGSFAAATNFVVGNTPLSVATGDFNGDGKLDVVAANYGANVNTVSVLLGNGAGGFAVAANFSTNVGPGAVTTGDFNEDGRLDLATANTGSDDVSILLGNGAGGFATAVNYAVTVGGGPVSITTADFNGDGRKDIATANRYANTMSVLLGNGAGSFTVTNFNTSGQPKSITTGDFNGDSKPDLVIANNVERNISILLNTCSSNCAVTSFTTPNSFSAGVNPSAITTGDFNRDGRLDLATANSTSNNISVLLGNSAGGFATAVRFPVGAGTAPGSITTVDVNGDGKLDIATANYNVSEISVLLGNGTGGFGNPSSFGTDDNPTDITSGDFNGDGKADIVTINFTDRNISVLLGDGAGGFAYRIMGGIVGTQPASVTTGDFNRDGRLDLAVANTEDDNVTVMLGDGTGRFQRSNIHADNGPYSVTTGDFNGDGKIDIATANTFSDNVSVWLGNGAGGFATAVNFTVSDGPFRITSGDFNGDGKVDIVTANYYANNVSLLLGNGTGGFAAPVNFSAGSHPNSITTGDFNKNGKLDLAILNDGSSNISLFLNACAIPKPVITAGGPTTFCASSNVVLSAPAGFASYLWSNGATTQSITVNQTGSYTVTVSIGGSTSPASNPIAVTANALPAIPSVIIVQPACTVANGTITVTTPTGTGITYSINGTTYQASATFSNVAPGTYSVRAKNSIGCISVAASVIINAAPATPATPTVSVTQPTCSFTRGSIMVNTPTGSGITYSINGSTYQTSATFSNLNPGSYNVTARNSSGCTSALLPVIINSAPPVPAPPSTTVVQPSCTVATGTITVNTPTGTGITYSINGTTYQTSNVFNNVAPGSYSVRAKNSSGCISLSANPVVVSVSAPTGLALGGAADNATASNGTTTTLSTNCGYIASVTSSGTSPVSGSVAATAFVENAELTTASNIYIRRHVQITSATNPTTATGRVTLYALQSEFDSYNAISSAALPTGPTDAAGISRLRIYKYSGSSSNGTGLPGTYTGTPLVIDPADTDITWNSTGQYWQISFDVTGFSGFFIGSAGAVILPVKLTGFTAIKQGSNGLLTWQVAQEENIATYTIERSADGNRYTSIGSIASPGNTTAARSYRFTDANVLKGANYYRLKITEKDGKMSYSEVRLLNWGSIISIAVFPNPAKEQATITGVEAGMQIRLLDGVGKVLRVQTAGGNTETMVISSFAKGVYSIQVYGKDGSLLSTARLVKE